MVQNYNSSFGGKLSDNEKGNGKKNFKVKFFWVGILLMLFSAAGYSQTTLISPTGDGGFETGATFAANGWTAVNGSATNRVWYVGTGQTGYTGSRAAFIGNSTTTVGSTTTSVTVHLYKSITIPAGATNISLSFKYKQAAADYSSGTYYDYIAVYTNPSAPVSGTLPTTGGALQFGPYPQANVTSFTTQTATLPNSLAGTTTNLIFTFKAETVSPHGYGAIDDVSLTYTPATGPFLSAGTLAAFANTCIDATAGPNTFTVSGGNLTGDVTVGASSGYTYSTTSGGTYTSTLTLTPSSGTINQTVHVKFTPTAATSYTSNISVAGGGASTVTVTPSGTGVNTTPTSSVSSAIATSATLTGITISGATISSLGCSNVIASGYGIEYSTTAAFTGGTGTQVTGSGFSGSAGGTFNATLSGLTANTTYYYRSYATNAGGTSYSAATGTFVTATANQIGSGTATSSFYPIYSNFGYSYSQQIYLASEYNTVVSTGNTYITKIRFKQVTAGTVANYNNWTVFMGNTSKNVFSSTSDWVSPASLSQVFTGTVTPVAGAWMEITLTTPFLWDGTSNIVVAVDENAANFSSSTWQSYTASSNRAIQFYSDSINPDPSAPPTSGSSFQTLTTNLSQIQFVAVLPPNCLPVTAITAAATSHSTGTASWTAPSSGDTPVGYNWELRTSGAAGSGATGLAFSGSPTSATANFTGLTPNTTYSFYVRTDCGSTQSTWSSASTFTTQPITATSSGSFSIGANWNNGTGPVCGQIAIIPNGIAMTHASGTVDAGNLTISAGGSLTISGGTVTVGCTANNSTLSNSGSLTVSGGTLTVNGNIFNATGSTFAQSGGDIIIDGNDNGNTATSVASGTPLLGFGTSTVSFATGAINLTGGTLTVVDPHTAATNTNGYAVYANLPTGVNFDASTSHTLKLGNGTSTQPGGHTSGFYLGLYAGLGRLNLGNLIVNNPSGTNRNTLQNFAHAINGNLTITAGTFSQGTANTSIGGNLLVENGGIFLTGGTTIFGTTTGITTGSQSTAQSVSVTGSGLIQNLAASPTANFASLTTFNTSATGLTINALNQIVVNADIVANVLTTITFNGKISTPSGKALLGGTATTPATTITVNSGGMVPGSGFARGWNAGTGGTAINAGSAPSVNANNFHPLMDANGNARYVWIERVTPSAAGILVVKYTDEAGLNDLSPAVTDGTYTIDKQSKGKWSVSAAGTSIGAATYKIAMSAPLIFGATPSTTDVRVMTVNSVVGTHQNGTTAPHAQRAGLTLAELTAQDFYMGINSSDIPFYSVQTGNWEDGTTWNKGVAPTSTDNVTISASTTVTVHTAASVAGVTVNAGGILQADSNTLTLTNAITNNGTVNVAGGTIAVGTIITNNSGANVNVTSGTLNVTGASTTGITNTGTFTQSGGTVNVGITDNSFANRRFTNTGTLTISGGTLNIFGNLSHSGTAFNQSGGNINIDGNAGGVVANSVASGTYLLNITSANVNWTAGTLTIVDPHTSATYSLYYSSSTAVNLTTGSHTLRLGDGISVDAGDTTYGFRMYVYASTAKMSFYNITVNGGAGATRFAAISTGTGVNGTFTVNAGSEFRDLGSILYVAGDVVNNGTYTSTAALALSGYSNITASASTNAQSVGGTGTFRNSTTTSTASLNSLTVNNSNSTGVTLNVPLSVSGTLTLTAGKVNTTDTNLLTLGTATAAGTLSGGSTTAYITGPFARTFAASKTASALGVVNLFPVGKSAYLPINVDPVTNAGGPVVYKAEAFVTNSGTMGAGVTSISSNRWEALITSGAANVTNTIVRLGDALLGSTSKIIEAPSAAGEYHAIPSAITYTAGTPNTIATASAFEPADYTGYFAYGELNNCLPPANQATAFNLVSKTTTGIVANFTAAPSAPSHYLVVAQPAANTPVAPADFVTPVAANLGTGAIILYNGPLTNFTGSGLTANTSYNIYVYSYNNAGCFGPAFNTTSPLTYAVTTCAATTGSPGTPIASAITATGFTATWTASSTSGVDYILEVATNTTFTSYVSGYNNVNIGTVLSTPITGLTTGTTYYVRVRANVGGCVSTNTTYTTVSTHLVVPAPWNEPFATTTLPSGWTNTSSWTIGSIAAIGGNPGNAIYKNLYDGFSNTTANFATLNIGPLPAAQQLSFDYKLANYNSPYGAVPADTGNLVIDISTDYGATYTNLMTINNDGIAGWHSITEFDLSAYAGMTVKFRVTGTVTDLTQDYYLAFDNFDIKSLPACIRPATLAVGNTTSTTADASWTGAGTNFDVKYGATGFNVASAGTLVEDITTTSYQIAGLTESNLYDVYVRRDCGVDGISEWRGPVTFRAGYTYSSGKIPTQLNTTPTVASAACTPDAIISIAVPAGQRIASLTVKYNITALPNIYDPIDDDYYDSFMSEQRSMLYSPSLSAGETGLAVGAGDASGTYAYNRAVTFANGATGTVTFALRAWRLWGGTDCSTAVQYVDANSWQLIPVFEPIPSCLNPTALTVAYTSATTANLSWTAPAATTVTSYEYAVSTSVTPPSVGTEVAGTSVTGYSGITAGVQHYLHVRTECEEGTYSPWITLPFTPAVCTPSTAFANNLYMNSFIATGFTTFTKTSTDSAYSDFTSSTVSQYLGQPVNFTAAFYKFSSSWTVGFNVWIDWNGDYDFDDAGENVYTGTATGASLANSFNIPPGTAIGSYRMRIRSEYNNGDALLNQPCGTIVAGEAEDYTFNVIAVPTCYLPTALTATATSFTTANLGWTAPATGTTVGYQYAVTTSATPPGSGTNTTATSITGHSGLTAETTYYLHVRAYCGPTDGYGEWVSKSFYTGSCVPASAGTTYYMTNFATTGGSINISNTNSGNSPAGYGNFSATQKVSQLAGGTVNFTASFSTSTYGLAIWVDWNNDLVFDNATERMYVSSAYSGTYANSFIVPSDKVPGNYRMRVLADFNSTAPSNPCAFSSNVGEAEDYTMTVLPPPPAVTSFTPIAACAQSGDSITITGTNFTGATAVKFNGLDAASFVVNSATSITAVLPASATTGTVSVTTPDGTGTSVVSFTINPLPVVANISGGDTTICTGGTAQLASSSDIGTGVWSSSNESVAHVDVATGLVTGMGAGTATITYTATSNGCSAFKTTGITVNGAIEITSFTNAQTVTPGDNTQFAVVATGTVTGYQWHISTDNGANYTALTNTGAYSGVTTATLNITNVDETFNANRYRVVITGATPCSPVVSEEGLLSVSEIGITTQPQNVTLCGTGNAQFSVVAEGAGLTYLWYENQGSGMVAITNGTFGGVTYSGATSATLNVNNAGVATNGWSYLVVVTDATSAEAVSGSATLTVNSAPQITTHPSDGVACSTGTVVNYSVVATGTGISYQWQYATSASGPWTSVTDATPAGTSYSGAVTATLTVTTTAATPAATYYYRAVVTGAAQCTDAISNVATLSINTPVITSQPAAASSVGGSSAIFTVATSAPSPTYQWQYGTSASGPWSNVAAATPAGTTYSGNTTASLTVNTNTTAAGSYYYRAVVTSGGCVVNSNSAALTVTGYCVGTFTNAPATDYMSAISIANTTLAATPAANSTAPYYTLLTGAGNTGTLYKGYAYTASVTVTTGGTTQGVGVWLDTNDDGDFADTGEFIGSASLTSSTTGNVSITIPANTPSGVHRMRFRNVRNGTIVTAMSCNSQGRGTTNDFNITVSEAPVCTGTPANAVIASSTATLCTSGTASFTATGLPTYVSGVTLQWYNTAGAISGANSATYTTPTITATETYYLRVTCSGSGLHSDSNQVTVTVTTPLVTGTTPGSRCGTGTVALSATGSAGATLSWYAASSGGTALGTGTTFTTPSISTTTSYYVEAGTGAAPQYGGKLTTTGSDGSTTGNLSGVVFNSTIATIVKSAVIYPTGTGTVTLALYNSSGTELSSTGAIPVTGSGISTPVTIPINLNVPIGTGMRLLIKSTTGITGLIRDFTGISYPYTTTNTSVTGGWYSGSSSTSYYFLYNIAFGDGCTSARTAVAATVNAAPALTLSSSSVTTCAGSSSSAVTIATGAEDFDTYVWSPNTGVSGNSTAGWTFNPSVTTAYTLTASQSGGSNCVAIRAVNVTVNGAPTAVTVTPNATEVCSGQAVQLTASGGLLTGSFTLGTQTTTTSTAGITPFTSNYEGARSQYLIRASELTALGITAGNISSLAFTVTGQGVGTYPQLNYAIKIGKTNATAISGGYASVVGSYTTVFTAASVPAPAVGERLFTFSTPYAWDGTSNIIVDICHDGDITGTCTSCFSSNSTVAAMTTSFNSVYGSYADNAANCGVTASSTVSTYTTRPVMKFGADQAGNVTWLPTTGLYTDAAATVAYAGGNVAAVYAKPAETTTYTATVTAGNACTASNTATVTVTDKNWTGAVSTNWNTAGNWCGGTVPTASDKVVIPNVTNKPVISGNISAFANTLKIESGAVLTVSSGNTLTVTGVIDIAAAKGLVVENYASLKQVNDVTNTGSGTAEVHRNSSKLYRNDFTLWSSPVANQGLFQFSPNTLATRFNTYNQATDQFNAITGLGPQSTTTFATAASYLIRMPDAQKTGTGQPTGTYVPAILGPPGQDYNASMQRMIFNGKYDGKPNNGDITFAAATSVNGYNAIGNPYPSPISISAFFAENGSNTDGIAYVWRKRNGTAGSAYCTVTADGEYNGNLQPEAENPGGKFQIGQGFIVKASGPIVFNNDMRQVVTSVDSTFFRAPNVEKHRIRLNLNKGTVPVAQMLVLYRTNATMGVDHGIDGLYLNDASVGLNSMIGSTAYAIQGRSLPFSNEDVVPLQFKADTAGSYTISMAEFDGLFAGSQDIFLKDKLLNVTQSIKNASYTFSSTQGTFSDRFEVVFTNVALGTDDPVIDPNTVVIYKNDNKLHIDSGRAVMKDIRIFDIRGRLVYEKTGVNATTAEVTGLTVQEEMLIVQVTTVENAKVSKKVIY